MNNWTKEIDVYDDYLESASSIQNSYQEFSIENKKYNMTSPSFEWSGGYRGGTPIWGDKSREKVYINSEDMHTMVLGATGSKKTRLVIMPTVRLLGWADESMIISDPKAEIYNRTAGELEKLGYNIYVINLRDPGMGDAWNPLSVPYAFYKEGDIDKACELVNDIARNIITEEKDISEPFWRNSAVDMFFGLVLILFKLCIENELDEMNVNLSNILKLRSQLFDCVSPKDTALWRYVKNDDLISASLNGTVTTAKDTRAGIISTFDQKVRYFFYQPNLMDMLANNSINFDEIIDRKTAVYLIMPDEKTTFHVLVSLFIKQSYEYIIYRAQMSDEGKTPIRLNYVLDEFAALPTINDFPTMISAARSRNIRFCLSIQSKHQLKQRYSEETETILSNCENWIFLTSREVMLLEEISKLCGTVQHGSLPLVSVFSLQHLNKEQGQALILCGRKRPFFTNLLDIKDYDKDIFAKRAIPKAALRKKRISIDGNMLASKLLSKAELMKCEFIVGDDGNNYKQIVPKTETEMNYITEETQGYMQYLEGNFEEAKRHYINAIECDPLAGEDGMSRNNLAYMLRRKEIDSVEIKGKNYSVPELLEKGVRENESYSLINRALYDSWVKDRIYWENGDYYIKKIDLSMVSEPLKWWEDLAEKGEREGYIVLYWLYRNNIIKKSRIGNMDKIKSILNEKYNIIT